METVAALDAFGALSQGTRLQAFRLLVKHEPGGLAAGDLARLLSVPANTLSAHLNVLTQAHLVTSVRMSRSIFYRAQLSRIEELVLFLLEDCRGGRPIYAVKFWRMSCGSCLSGPRDANATFDLSRRLFAAILGTALLVATVVGSGIMAERLTRDVALGLLANTLATGAILVVLITILGPISGAQFNPAVSLVFAFRRELSAKDLPYIAAQVIGGILGAMMAHGMFGLALLAASSRSGTGGPNGSPRPSRPLASSRPFFWASFQETPRRGWSASNHLGILVHRIDLVRQSRRYDRSRVDQYLFRNPSDGPAGIYYRRTLRRRRRHALDDLAFASKWI